MPDPRPDLCVIGGGTAGHALAFAAAALGARCVLVDPRERLGVGQAADLLEAMLFAQPAGAEFDLATFRRRLGAALATQAPTHAAARLASAGVAVRRGNGAFIDPRGFRLGSETIRARRFVIATGAEARLPLWATTLPAGRLLRPAELIAGDRLPAELAIVGLTSVALAWAQALARLGTRTTLWLVPSATAALDEELAATVLAALRADRVAIRSADAPLQTAPDTAAPILLVGATAPATAGLALEAAGIEAHADAPRVDARFRTSNRHVFAIGDVLGSGAAQRAVAGLVGAVLRGAVLGLQSRPQPTLTLVPTRPALAQVGAPGLARGAEACHVHRHPLDEVSPGVPGLARIVANARGRIRGVGLVAAGAAEAIAPWSLAIEQGLSLDAMAGLACPPGTAVEASRRAAVGVLAARLRGPWVRRLIAAVRWLP